LFALSLYLLCLPMVLISRLTVTITDTSTALLLLRLFLDVAVTFTFEGADARLLQEALCRCCEALRCAAPALDCVLCGGHAMNRWCCGASLLMLRVCFC
jgi:hypothetical protein